MFRGAGLLGVHAHKEQAVNFVVRGGVRVFYIQLCIECRPIDLELEDFPEE